MPDVYLRAIEPLIAIILDRVCGSDPQSPLRRAIAAHLGRFLPRLGPLVATQAAFLLCATIGFAGPLGRIANRGDHATAIIEHICSFRFSSFVSTMPRKCGVTLQPFR